MGVEIAEEEPEKTEEELSPAKDSSGNKVEKKSKSPMKKKETKKIKIEPDIIQPPIKEEAKKLAEPKTEEKKEAVETKKPFFPKIEKKEENSHRGFNLQNLSAQEGQLAVDVYQTDAELVIQSTIAGVKTENLDISIEADTVLIRGNRSEPPEQGEKNYFYQECYWGPFSRQIILPEETDPSRAEAVMKEGVLTIRIPKIEREKKRKITVKE